MKKFKFQQKNLAELSTIITSKSDLAALKGGNVNKDELISALITANTNEGTGDDSCMSGGC